MALIAHQSDFALQRRALCACCQKMWVEHEYQECPECIADVNAMQEQSRERIERWKREDEEAKAWARHWSELNDAEQYDHTDDLERNDDDA